MSAFINIIACLIQKSRGNQVSFDFDLLARSVALSIWSVWLENSNQLLDSYSSGL